MNVATVRGSSRLLPCEIAAWIFSRADSPGRLHYGGIQYLSHIGDTASPEWGRAQNALGPWSTTQRLWMAGRPT